MSEKKYTLTLTQKQLKVLNYACDQFSRLICGQDWSYQNLMEEAWEKRSKKATGKSMDKDFEGGWQEMRHDAERLSKEIKKRFWGLESNAMYGIHYDDYADILFDLHRVLRHQLWNDKEVKSNWTVDAEDPTHSIGNEPLAEIKAKED